MGQWVAPAQPTAAPTPGHARTRVGTYDTRAVAIAYGRSQGTADQFKQLHSDHQKAKASGNAARAAELEKQAASRQIRMHLQAFSNAPVGDAIDSVKDRLPALAHRAGVAVIVNAVEFHDPSVEVVDVTDELVKLFGPTPETLKAVAECRKVAPLPIEQVAQMPAVK